MDEQGCTPLHYAARRKYGRLTKLLLDGGADVTIRDMTGRTATDWAKAKDCQYALEALNGEKIDSFHSLSRQFVPHNQGKSVQCFSPAIEFLFS